jgi:hypothetical protein
VRSFFNPAYVQPPCFERFHMGIALLSVTSVLTQLGAWMTAKSAHENLASPVMRVQKRVTPQNWARQTVNGHSTGHRLSTATPLRVVRWNESESTTGFTGRIRISGLMADVCAELDRLAAKEAQILSH